MTIVVRQPGRLPGRLALARALVHASKVPASYVVPIALVAVYPIVAAFVYGPWIAVLLTALASVWPAMVSLRAVHRGVRVTASSQPRLVELVDSVARGLEHEPPVRIRLIARARVTHATAAGRRELHIGLPLLACLEEAELRALVAHALSTLQHPYPLVVQRVLARWSDAVQVLEDEDVGGRKRRAARRTVAALREFAVEVHRLADTAAAHASGGWEVAGRAFALQQKIPFEHHVYVFRTDAAMPPKRWPARAAISDLDDAWRRLLGRGVDLYWFDSDQADLDREHPRLAGHPAWPDGTLVRLAPPARPVALSPLSRRQERRLARHAHRLRDNEPIRWYTFATAPTSWWVDRAAREADDVRGDVVRVLGRAPVDDLETLDVVVNRNDELLAVAYPEAAGPASEPAGDDRPTGPPPVVASVVEQTLFARGWRLEHPAVRGVLVSPAGERVDALSLVTYGRDGRADLTALRSLLLG